MSPDSPDARSTGGEPESRDGAWTGRLWMRRLLIPLTILTWGVLIFCALVLAGHFVETLIFIAIAVLIAYALEPAVSRLDDRMPRWLALLVTYVLFGAALAAFVFAIVQTLTSEVPAFSGFVQRELANSQVQPLLRRAGITPGSIGLGSNGGLLGGLAGLAGNILPVVTGVASGAIGIVVILVLSVYFIADAPRVGRWLRSQTPIDQRERVVYVIETSNRVIGGYIRGQVTLAALVGLLVGLGMFAFRLPFAALLGLLAFVLEFIPFLGVIVSGAACVLVALTQGFFLALLVLGYFVIIHVLEGDVVGPRIVGRFVGLHPAVALIALVAGAELFGIWGALFASPVAGLLQAFIQTLWLEYRRTHRDLFPDPAPDAATPDGHPRPPGEEARAQAEHSSQHSDRFGGIFFRRPRTPASE
jgi:predicted PurR-regulated permease PerM